MSGKDQDRAAIDDLSRAVNEALDAAQVAGFRVDRLAGSDPEPPPAATDTGEDSNPGDAGTPQPGSLQPASVGEPMAPNEPISPADNHRPSDPDGEEPPA
jgi:hypothetical protein